MDNDVRITFRAPATLRQQVCDLAVKSGWTESELYRGATELLIEQRDRLLPKSPLRKPQ